MVTYSNLASKIHFILIVFIRKIKSQEIAKHVDLKSPTSFMKLNPEFAAHPNMSLSVHILQELIHKEDNPQSPMIRFRY